MQPISTSIYDIEISKKQESLTEKADRLLLETAIVSELIDKLNESTERDRQKAAIVKAKIIERERKEKIIYVVIGLFSLTVIGITLASTK